MLAAMGLDATSERVRRRAQAPRRRRARAGARRRLAARAAHPQDPHRRGAGVESIHPSARVSHTPPTHVVRGRAHAAARAARRRPRARAAPGRSARARRRRARDRDRARRARRRRAASARRPRSRRSRGRRTVGSVSAPKQVSTSRRWRSAPEVVVVARAHRDDRDRLAAQRLDGHVVEEVLERPGHRAAVDRRREHDGVGGGDRADVAAVSSPSTSSGRPSAAAIRRSPRSISSTSDRWRSAARSSASLTARRSRPGARRAAEHGDEARTGGVRHAGQLPTRASAPGDRVAVVGHGRAVAHAASRRQPSTSRRRPRRRPPRDGSAPPRGPASRTATPERAAGLEVEVSSVARAALARLAEPRGACAGRRNTNITSPSSASALALPAASSHPVRARTASRRAPAASRARAAPTARRGASRRSSAVAVAPRAHADGPLAADDGVEVLEHAGGDHADVAALVERSLRRGLGACGSSIGTHGPSPVTSRGGARL